MKLNAFAFAIVISTSQMAFANEALDIVNADYIQMRAFDKGSIYLKPKESETETDSEEVADQDKQAKADLAKLEQIAEKNLLTGDKTVARHAFIRLLQIKYTGGDPGARLYARKNLPRYFKNCANYSECTLAVKELSDLIHIDAPEVLVALLSAQQDEDFKNFKLLNLSVVKPEQTFIRDILKLESSPLRELVIYQFKSLLAQTALYANSHLASREGFGMQPRMDEDLQIQFMELFESLRKEFGDKWGSRKPADVKNELSSWMLKQIPKESDQQLDQETQTKLVEQLTEALSKGLINNLEGNLTAAAYVKRFNQTDIRPWLASLDKLGPIVARRTLARFAIYEVNLPSREDWVAAIYSYSQNAKISPGVVSSEAVEALVGANLLKLKQGEMETVLKLAKTNATMKLSECRSREISKWHDNNLPRLVCYEKWLSTHTTDFHSLSHQFLLHARAVDRMNQSKAKLDARDLKKMAEYKNSNWFAYHGKKIVNGIGEAASETYTVISDWFTNQNTIGPDPLESSYETALHEYIVRHLTMQCFQLLTFHQVTKQMTPYKYGDQVFDLQSLCFPESIWPRNQDTLNVDAGLQLGNISQRVERTVTLEKVKSMQKQIKIMIAFEVAQMPLLILSGATSRFFTRPLAGAIERAILVKGVDYAAQSFLRRITMRFIVASVDFTAFTMINKVYNGALMATINGMDFDSFKKVWYDPDKPIHETYMTEIMWGSAIFFFQPMISFVTERFAGKLLNIQNSTHFWNSGKTWKGFFQKQVPFVLITGGADTAFFATLPYIEHTVNGLFEKEAKDQDDAISAQRKKEIREPDNLLRSTYIAFGFRLAHRSFGGLGGSFNIAPRDSDMMKSYLSFVARKEQFDRTLESYIEKPSKFKDQLALDQASLKAEREKLNQTFKKYFDAMGINPKDITGLEVEIPNHPLIDRK